MLFFFCFFFLTEIWYLYTSMWKCCLPLHLFQQFLFFVWYFMKILKCLCIVCRSYTLLVYLDIFAYFNFLDLAWFMTFLLNWWLIILIQTVLLIRIEKNLQSTAVLNSYDPCCAQYLLMDRLYQHDMCSLSQALFSTFIYDWCTASKWCDWLQEYPAHLWHLPSLWDPECEAWTGQWFQICWHEHLQCYGEGPKVISILLIFI